MTQFNLISEPWIKVITKSSHHESKESKISLYELFTHVNDYQSLSGEMKTQDLAILRLILAIATTVYTRYDANDEPYEWLNLDSNTMRPTKIRNSDYDNTDLIDTWSTLYKTKQFTHKIIEYLDTYKSRFDMVGEHPFYQVTTEQYNKMVPANKQIKLQSTNGLVPIKQINRTISESNNSPNIAASKSDDYKNSLEIDELVRWLITYQNACGTTEKTKLQTKDTKLPSNTPGWLYRLNTVYVEGDTLFDTIMLNLILGKSTEYHNQKPVWEYDNIYEYAEMIKTQEVPDNISELYTLQSRFIVINWVENHPTLYSCGLPGPSSNNAFIEPMTTWRYSQFNQAYTPNRKAKETMSKSMWEYYGNYIGLSHDNESLPKPGIIEWLNKLSDVELISDKSLHLATANFINDGQATSQLPIAESYDRFIINASVLFDKSTRWNQRIMDAINTTNHIGNMYWKFNKDLAELKNYDSNLSSKMANKKLRELYDNFNVPFDNWLQSLTPNDDRDVKINEWYETVRRITKAQISIIMNNATASEINGKIQNQRPQNIFTLYNSLLNYMAREFNHT